MSQHSKTILCFWNVLDEISSKNTTLMGYRSTWDPQRGGPKLWNFRNSIKWKLLTGDVICRRCRISGWNLSLSQNLTEHRLLQASWSQCRSMTSAIRKTQFYQPRRFKISDWADQASVFLKDLNTTVVGASMQSLIQFIFHLLEPPTRTEIRKRLCIHCVGFHPRYRQQTTARERRRGWGGVSCM